MTAGRGGRALGWACTALAAAACAWSAGREVAARTVTHQDLERASAGRTVRVRIGANGAAGVVDLPVEVYVARVLAAEGEPRAGAAAQQALAIAIRTFAAANAGRHRRGGFDLCDTTHCQVLRPSTPSSREAAAATASQLLTYEGRPASVFYSASCGGRSEAPSQVWPGAIDPPYLRTLDDGVHAGEQEWSTEQPIERIEQALRRQGFEGRRLRDVAVERRSPSGRVTLLRLDGMRPDVIAGETFRTALGPHELRSTQFTVARRGGSVRFTGRGYGHGVGLCVIGAGRRAARGESALEILRRYYPGVQVQPLAAVSGAAAAPVAPAPRAEAPHEPRASQLARRAVEELAAALGVARRPAVRVEVHDSLEAFRAATGHPWWVSFAVTGTQIDLAPPTSLEAGDGLEASVRRAVVELLVADDLAGRPAWVRVGAGRYYAASPRLDLSAHQARCPSDAELMMAVSASAHREAGLRAEACFAHALGRTGDWRQVR